MPRTENQKAATAYLSLELYDKLEQFKLEEGLKSDSKAINTILERWFFGEVPIPAITKTNHLEERLSHVEEVCRYLRGQVSSLVALAYDNSTIPSDVPDIVPSTTDDTIPSDVPDIVPSTIDDTIPSDVPDIVPSTTVDTVPSDVPDIVPSTTDDTIPSDVPKLVVCKLYKNAAKDPQSWRYWAGAKAGFVEDLSKAKTYTEKGSSKVINQLLEDEIHKPTSRERISCRALEELTALAINYEKVC